MRKAFIYFIFLTFIILSGILNFISMKDSILVNNIEKELKFQGIVEDIKWREEEEGKYVVRIEHIKDEKLSYNIKEKAMLKVLGERQPNLGETIAFKGMARKPLRNTNPKLYNYRLSLLSDKIYTTINIRDHSIIGINGENKRLKYRLRAGFKDSIENIFDSNLSRESSSLIKSIILGESRYLEDEDISRYRELGLAHILAVSGLHIGIIVGFIVFILSNLGIKRNKVYIVSLLIIWFYGFLIAYPISILRANIMMTILFLGRIIAEPYDPIHGLVLSIFILLTINPFWIFNIGFQLSHMATFSIIYFPPKIQRLFYPYKNKFLYGLWGILGVQIGLLPIQAYYFNEIPVISILSNLLIAPILSLALILASLITALSPLTLSLNPLLGLILDIVIGLQFKLIEIFHRIPYGKISLATPSMVEIIIYYILILALLRVIDLKKLKLEIKKTILYSLLFYTVISSLIILTDKSLEIDFIDVGQGDSILIRSKAKNYLIDTGGNLFGSFDIGENITLPYLRKHGVKKIHGLFITHFHEDHSKALPLLINNLEIENILISYKNPDSPAYNSIIESQTPYIILRDGDRFLLDQNIVVEVLSPSKTFLKRNLGENDLSLVFMLRYYNKEILFTGDMEEVAESHLLSKLDSPIDLIKVPHHGSDTSSSKELLEKIRPEFGIITVGQNNLYNHPRGEVLARYKDIGTKIYRTDTMGRIKVILDKDDIRIEAFLKENENVLEYVNDYILLFAYYLLYYLGVYILVRIYVLTEGELN